MKKIRNCYENMELLVEVAEHGMIELSVRVNDLKNADKVQFVLRNIKNHVLGSQLEKAENIVQSKLEIPCSNEWNKGDLTVSYKVTAELIRDDCVLDLVTVSFVY